MKLKEIVKNAVQRAEFPIRGCGPGAGLEDTLVLAGRFFQWKGFSRMRYAPAGMIAQSPKGNVLLQNGDETDHEDELDTYGMYSEGVPAVTVSLICLKRLLRRANVWSIPKITILDRTNDSYIPLTPVESKAKPFTLKPRPGYSLVNGEWHRSATIVFTVDSDRKNTCLLGTDEGSYFGVKIPGRHSTVKACYEALIPKIARGKAFQRQGEWFLVPVKDSEVPEVPKCLVTCAGPDCQVDEPDGPHNWAGFALPVTDDGSSRHLITSDDIRVAKNGTVYALDPTLKHSRSQHKEVYARGWVRFACNTALRAVSVQGVD